MELKAVVPNPLRGAERFVGDFLRYLGASFSGASDYGERVQNANAC